MRRLVSLVLLLALLLPTSVRAMPRAATGAIKYLYVIPLSHLDVGFTTSPPELERQEKQYLDQAIRFAEQYPSYHWTIENVWQYDQWAARTTDPSAYRRLEAQLAAGKIELAAGYVNSHEGEWGAEEANRFLYPARRAGSALGVTPHTAFVDDVPGSSWALPQILAANGVTNLVAGINTVFGGEPDIPVKDSLFTWQGVDGSEVLTWISRKSYAEGLADYKLSSPYPQMEAATQSMIDFYESNGYAYDSIIVMDGFDNSSPDLELGALSNVNQWNQEHASPQMIVATPSQFFDHVRAVYGNGFTRYSGDWSGRWETNDAHTPITTGLVRAATSSAPAAETLTSLSRLLGTSNAPYPADAFDLAYRGALQFHDHNGAGASGVMTQQQVQDSDVWFVQLASQTSSLATQLLAKSAASLANGIRRDQDCILVLNPLPWTRTDLARVPTSTLPSSWRARGAPTLVDLATGTSVPTQLVDNGQTLLFRADALPAFGYKEYGLAPVRAAGHPARNRQASSASIENEFYRVSVDPGTGAITSIFDKQANRELVASGADYTFNGLISAKQASAFVYGTSQKVASGTVTITTDSGPVGTRLAISRAGTPFISTELWLYSGIARLDIVNTLDRAHMPRVSRDDDALWYFYTFPFNVASGFAGEFQGPSGFLVPQRDWIPGTSHGARVSRAVTDVRGGDGFGVSLANRETYLSAFGTLGFWNENNPSAPTLFPTAFAKQDYQYTTDHGWVVFPTLEPGEPSRYTAHYALTSSSGGFDPVAATHFGAGFTTELLARFLRARPSGALPGPSAGLLATDQPNVIVTTLKGAEFDNVSGHDYILRVQEIAGQATRGVQLATPIQVRSAELNGLSEQRDSPTPLPTNPVRFDIGAYQTLTIRLQPQ